jgi:hypothetical protein
MMELRFGDIQLPDRLVDKIHSCPMTGCWLWTGCINAKGYGWAFSEGRSRHVHRIVYELLVGEIPRGFHVDHLCRVRNCCAPWHLEPVTPAENAARGLPGKRGSRERARTHCPAGHEYSGSNVFIKNGSRECRECGRVRQRAYSARKRLRLIEQRREDLSGCSH